jgi:hypothetical protein
VNVYFGNGGLCFQHGEVRLFGRRGNVQVRGHFDRHGALTWNE